MTDKYAVFGNPIEHSKSPEIHRYFAKKTGQDISYEKQLVALDNFAVAVEQFISDGGKGMNITVPFKQEAYQLAQQLSKRARQAGAVNTLILGDDGVITGDNTDGLGMVADIQNNHSWEIQDKTVLLLGAGGAVRGVLGPLLEAQPKQVVIANRTLEKAESLAQAFSKQGNISAVAFEKIPQQAFDFIINGTSASLSGSVPPIPVSAVGKQTACYDMMYAQQLTPFLQWASDQGSQQLADGLGMLVEQAAESFRLWRGIKPETQPLIVQMREQQ